MDTCHTMEVAQTDIHRLGGVPALVHTWQIMFTPLHPPCRLFMQDLELVDWLAQNLDPSVGGVPWWSLASALAHHA